MTGYPLHYVYLKVVSCTQGSLPSRLPHIQCGILRIE